MPITVDVLEPLSDRSTEDWPDAPDGSSSSTRRVPDPTRSEGARVLDMTLNGFLIDAGRHGMYVVDYDVDDFQRELDTMTTDRF